MFLRTAFFSFPPCGDQVTSSLSVRVLCFGCSPGDCLVETCKLWRQGWLLTAGITKICFYKEDEPFYASSGRRQKGLGGKSESKRSLHCPRAQFIPLLLWSPEHRWEKKVNCIFPPPCKSSSGAFSSWLPEWNST